MTNFIKNNLIKSTHKMKFFLLISLIFISVASTYATQLMVTTANDSGAGSLRGQVFAANPNDTIVFDTALNGSTILLTSGHIAFAKSLTIIGPGYNLLTISGNANSRVFYITAGDVKIKGLKLINGALINDSDGGAIKQETSGNLSLNNIYFLNNSCVNGNGSQGGSVYYAVNGGSFIGDSCFFMNSQADNYGGAVSFNGGPASVFLNYCWFDGNSAVNGPAGVLFTNTQSLTVTNSTFSNNSAAQRATFWIGATGSGTEVYNFTNCTMSHNTVTNSPYQEFGVTSGTLTLKNCTYTDNDEPIYVGESFMFGSGSLVVQNSIFNNVGNNFSTSGNPVLTSLGGNISNDASMTSFLISTNDLNNSNSLLGTLANYGGLMNTHELLAGSPAINNGVNQGAPIFDQIGNPRTGVFDSGSIEAPNCVITGTDVRTECNSYTWINGTTYTSSNNNATYTILGGAISGCDSLVTLNLTIQNVSNSNTSLSGLTITANNANAAYSWLDCGNNYAVISGETNQSYTATVNGSYAVQLTENGCVDTSSCVAITTVGISDNLFESNFNVYPNPNTGNFILNFNTPQSNLFISLYSIDGKLLFDKTNQNTTNVSLQITEPSGMYFLKIMNDNNQKATIRIMKD